MPGHDHGPVAAHRDDQKLGGPVAIEQPPGEPGGRGAGEQEGQILIAHLHDVGAGGGPLRGGARGPAIGRHRRPGVGVIAGDNVTPVARGFRQPQHLFAAGREHHAEGADVHGGAALGEPQSPHIPAEVELVAGGSLGVERGQRPAGGLARGSREDHLDAVVLQVCADEGAVVVRSDLRHQRRALPEPAERDGDIGRAAPGVDGELVVALAGDHIHERLADDSDHAIIPPDGAQALPDAGTASAPTPVNSPHPDRSSR